VNIDELHRPRERGDPVGDPQLNVGGPLCLLLQDNRVAPKGVLQLGLPVFQPGLLPADASCLRLWPVNGLGPLRPG